MIYTIFTLYTLANDLEFLLKRYNRYLFHKSKLKNYNLSNARCTAAVTCFGAVPPT